MDTLIMRWRIFGPLDVALLEVAIRDVVGRHPPLRSKLVVEDGQLLQITDDGGFPELRYLVAGGPSLALRNEEALRITREAGRIAGERALCGISAAVLVRLDDEYHLLSLVVHHAMCDGWSSQVLISEVSQCYSARLQGREPQLPSIEENYYDFTESQYRLYETGGYAEEIEYWRSELTDAPPAVRLPAVGARRGNRSFDCRCLVTFEPIQMYRDLQNLARVYRVTVFSVALALLASALNCRAGADDMLIGVSTLNRWGPKSMGFVGCATNLLPARVKLSGQDLFSDLCVQTNSTVRRLVTYGRLPLDLVVKETRKSMFDSLEMPVWCQFREAAPTVGSEVGRLLFKPLPIERSILVPEMEVDLIGSDDGLRCEFAYRSALFEEVMVSGLMADFHMLLDVALRTPAAPVDRMTALLE